METAEGRLGREGDAAPRHVPDHVRDELLPHVGLLLVSDVTMKLVPLLRHPAHFHHR